MESRTTVAPSSRYDDFLYAVICEDRNGTQVSVISALTRLDVDPWAEATRLETMKETDAKARLMAMLDRASAQNWNSSQKDAVARRLIELLPSPERDSFPIRVSETHGRMLFCLVLWWGFLLATAVFSNYKDKVDEVSVIHSGATVTSKSGPTDSARSTAD
ncbi:hypothetical protein IVA98_27175 [Bradyrhizobium sp. 160]|uniref:hypothetical protein n=1 Tax=unclassified Bradyrhizobium TaxID=2631580 RepID=UPI001FF79214|nr:MULTISPECIES: hypothetical protein [unclassified Bradyrhizobium]MCK1626770.1 hypothetical protein [Bradyrhizobium sp. 160]WFU23668.1 hypothetical protein QA649_37605 [Bradyrhizobium sp. CB1717]